MTTAIAPPFISFLLRLTLRSYLPPFPSLALLPPPPTTTNRHRRRHLAPVPATGTLPVLHDPRKDFAFVYLSVLESRKKRENM